MTAALSRPPAASRPLSAAFTFAELATHVRAGELLWWQIPMHPGFLVAVEAAAPWAPMGRPTGWLLLQLRYVDHPAVSEPFSLFLAPTDERTDFYPV